jgi:hypothetical protein
MDQAVEEAKLANASFIVGEFGATCALNYLDVPNIKEVINEAFTQLEYGLAFPATDWLFYVSQMLGSYISDVNNRTFLSSREGHPDGILVFVSFVTTTERASFCKIVCLLSHKLIVFIDLLPHKIRACRCLRIFTMIQVIFRPHLKDRRQILTLFPFRAQCPRDKTVSGNSPPQTQQLY